MTRAAAALGALALALTIAGGCDAVLGLGDYHLRESAGGAAGHGTGGSGGASGCTDSCNETCEECSEAQVCSPTPVYGTDEGCDSREVCDGARTCVNLALYGAPGPQRGVVMDARSGRVAIAGLFTGSVTFGTHTLTNIVGDDDIFVVVHGVGGAVGAVAVEATKARVDGVAIDPNGIVYVAGTVGPSGSVNGTGADLEVFLLRIDTLDNVEPVKAQVLQSQGEQWARALAVDGAGHVAVVGGFTGILDVDGPCTSVTSSSPDSAVFVAVYDDQLLSCVKRATFISPGNDEATAVAFDPEGSLVVGGNFDAGNNLPVFGTSILGSGTLNTLDIFVAKLDATVESTAWAHSLSTTDAENDRLHDLATKSDGNVVLVGQYAGSDLRLDDMSLNWTVGQPLVHPFVLELSSSEGTHVAGVPFVNATQSPDSTRLRVAIAADDNIVFGGVFRDTADFGGGELGTVGKLHPFTGVYNVAGTNFYPHRVHELSSGTETDLTVDVAATPDASRAMLGGSFAGTLTLRIDVPESSGVLTSNDAAPDVFLLDYAF